jgi:hypothetical protein
LDCRSRFHKQVAALNFGQAGPLTPFKIGVIVPRARELVVAGGATAERTVANHVLRHLARRIDRMFLDPTVASTAARTASITNGANVVTSTGSTAAQITTDVYSLLASVTTGGALAWVMKTTTAATSRARSAPRAISPIAPRDSRESSQTTRRRRSR